MGWPAALCGQQYPLPGEGAKVAEFILGQVKFDNASKEGIRVEMLSSWRRSAL